MGWGMGNINTIPVMILSHGRGQFKDSMRRVTHAGALSCCLGQDCLESLVSSLYVKRYQGAFWS